MKRFIWNILSWMDDNINHKFIDPLTNYFPLENKDDFDSWQYKLWENVFNKFCFWVNVTLAEKWNMFDE